MGRFRIAVRVDSLGLGAKAGIVAAGELGLEGVELDATRGDTTPENLSRTGRREVMRFISSRRLQICALSADFGLVVTDPHRADEWVDRTQKIIELAVDLGTMVVVAPAIAAPRNEAKPVVPLTPASRFDPEAVVKSGADNVASAALSDLAEIAANCGRFLAVRTGLNDGPAMAAFLDAAGECAKAALDPAALLTGGFDPAKAASDLGKRIVHVYARDAVGPGAGRARMAPLGEGQVDFKAVLAVLDGASYGGFFVIEAMAGADPLRSAGDAARFLRQF